MNCPLCNKLLKITVDEMNYIVHMCLDSDCINDDMPRFEVIFHDDKMIERNIMIDNYYIQTYFDANITVISKMIGYILADPISFHSIIEINMDNPQLSLSKIKRLMILS